MTYDQLKQVHVNSIVRHQGVRCKIFSTYLGDVQAGKYPVARGPYFRLTPAEPCETVLSAKIAGGLVAHEECEFVQPEQAKHEQQ